MKKLHTFNLIPVLVLTLLCSFTIAQDDDLGTDKLAQTGMKFLSFSPDARAAALGDAVTAKTGGASSLFYNPAGMARIEGMNLSAGQANWIAGITYNAVSVAYASDAGVFGISVMNVDYGEIQGTIRSSNTAGYADTELFTPTANVVGLGYAIAPTDRFSVGGQVKFVNEKLGNAYLDTDGSVEGIESLDMDAVAYDFGLMYQMDWKNLMIAMSARNFSESLKYAEEAFELPLTFRMGVAVDVIENLSLSFVNERPRDYFSTTRVGFEYSLMGMLAVRAGYVTPTDEAGINLGVGFQVAGFNVDVAYTDFGVFDPVTRVGVQFTL
jgi:hypothetical protein|tara:strand:- start:340 stop:1314 length:975 start_codon:yes stop_codon:yes gene_type:complete